MNIRSLEINDQIHIEKIMAGHPLQFPKFIIERYPQRWEAFFTIKDNKMCGYYVALAENDEVVGHAGYIFNKELGLYEIVGVVVSKKFQRKGIGNALINKVSSKLSELGKMQLILYTLGHVGNEASLSFYRSIGFEMINYEKDFFRADYHRVTFVKAL